MPPRWSRRTTRPAARRIMTDDGFNIGVLFAGDRKPYPTAPVSTRAEVSDLEAEFES